MLFVLVLKHTNTYHKAAEIEFGIMNINGEPTFFVLDNGAGFNMEYVSKLFKPFHSAHSPFE